MATDALNAAGYQCLTARSASQALITLNNPNYIFDLMISDVLMSGMNGIDLMKHAFKIHPEFAGHCYERRAAKYKSRSKPTAPAPLITLSNPSITKI